MKEYINYKDVFTDNEIIQYALIIDKFIENKITYKELKEELSIYGITIKPILRDISKKMMTKKQYKDLITRLDKEIYHYEDINCFIFANNICENIIFSFDYYIINLLANNNIPKYQESLIGILKTYIKNFEIKSKRDYLLKEKWYRQIEELRNKLNTKTKSI